MNIFASWSKLNSFKIITIKPKTLKVERNNQRFVECQRYCSDSRINAKKYKLKWLWKNYAKKYKLKWLWRNYNLFKILPKMLTFTVSYISDLQCGQVPRSQRSAHSLQPSNCLQQVAIDIDHFDNCLHIMQSKISLRWFFSCKSVSFLRSLTWSVLLNVITTAFSNFALTVCNF